VTGPHLDPSDAIELTEILQFLTDWLATDTDQLNTSLAHFVGHNSYTTTNLSQDLHRFAFLLGSNDGETLFNTQPS
jgi:hypothetical protein